MDTITRLEQIIQDRFQSDPDSSYVAKLRSKGAGTITRKLGEEAVELIVARLSGTREEQVSEAADLIFHLLVLLGEADIPMSEVMSELDRREGTSGLVEKASRSE